MTAVSGQAGPVDDRTGSPDTSTPRRRIGEVLVQAGVVTEEDVLNCLAQQAAQTASRRIRLGDMLVARGFATERDIARSLSEILGLPMSELANAEVSPEVARRLPRSVAERFLVMPIATDGDQLTVAMGDPTDIVALDDVRLYTKMRAIKVVIATPTAIRTHLNRVWSLGESAEMIALEGLDDDEVETRDEDASLVDDAPVVRLVHEILTDAVRAKASDIHLEPERRGLLIRYRVDGMLRDIMLVPRAATNALVSRTKIVSGLDIAERRRPQDGRTKLEVDGRFIDARVSTLPTLHGEKVVVRLLNRTEGVVSLAQIGLEEDQLATFLEIVTAPQGLILVTGPTGSGKTSTLYSAVTQLRTPDRNLVSLEDPVEIQLPGVNQVQVRERTGMTFANGLRSVLRQDPDVILVGEVRDHETAELALRASLTGHLVFTTLHTNDAASAVTRLVDMGVEPFLIASSLALVIAQRLVRVPCAACAAPYRPSPRTLDLLGLTAEDIADGDLRRGAGCDACGMTGYAGRTAIFELVAVDARMRAVLTSSPTESAIRTAARAAGASTIRGHGIVKAMRGETTLEEVLRVTQADAGSTLRCAGCHRVVEPGMSYCPWCASATDHHACPSCSARVEPEWRHCPWCQTPQVVRGAAEPVETTGSSDDVAVQEAPRRAVVLAVDDDPSVCASVAAALVGVADVIPAGTAEDALRICAIQDVDVAILDLNLPDLSGLEMARLLRSDPHTALIPLILLTGSTNTALVDEARHAGVDDVFAKPINGTVLEQRVEALLATTAAASALR
ncbi:MAG TPA: ATPase, T2SS/T4P/T4SS family [Mycobacteriales bacterium]|nr:ATPase, T2SS/T4P/T4SS family [Mycobacteriales bacterium]